MKCNRIIAIDLAKTVFEVCVLEQHNKVVCRKTFRRAALVRWLARQKASLVAVEACGGAHHWARVARASGHQAAIIPPRQVTPYRQGHKTDAQDALAIGIAAQQAELKTVGIKSLEQQSLQTAKRVQEHLSDQLTATGNALRALIAEFGLVVPKGASALAARVPAILDDPDNDLPADARPTLHMLYQHWRRQREALKLAEMTLVRRVRETEPCSRLSALEGIGPKNAVGLYIRLGNGAHFKNGREAAACTGLTPKQSSSGGKVRLGSIGKFRGDQRLRSSLITGAMSVVIALNKRGPRNAKEQWLKALIERRGPGRAAVALANKNVRTAWAMLRHSTDYQPTPLPAC